MVSNPPMPRQPAINSQTAGAEIRSTKPEIRNKSQTRMAEIINAGLEARRLGTFGLCSFVLVSSFDIRISDFHRSAVYRRSSPFICGSRPFCGVKEPSPSRRQAPVAACSVTSQCCQCTMCDAQPQPNSHFRAGDSNADWGQGAFDAGVTHRAKQSQFALRSR